MFENLNVLHLVPRRKLESLFYFPQAGWCHCPCSLTVSVTSPLEDFSLPSVLKGEQSRWFLAHRAHSKDSFFLLLESHSSLSQEIMNRFGTAIQIGLGTRILSIQEIAFLAVSAFCCPEIQVFYINPRSVLLPYYSGVLDYERPMKWLFNIVSTRLSLSFPPHTCLILNSSCDIQVRFELVMVLIEHVEEMRL